MDKAYVFFGVGEGVKGGVLVFLSLPCLPPRLFSSFFFPPPNPTAYLDGWTAGWDPPSHGHLCS